MSGNEKPVPSGSAGAMGSAGGGGGGGGGEYISEFEREDGGGGVSPATFIVSAMEEKAERMAAAYGGVSMAEANAAFTAAAQKLEGHRHSRWIMCTPSCPGFEKLQEELKASVQGDAVNHPPHYNQHPSGIECMTVVEWFNFCRGNAIKYIWRAGSKGDEIEDLKKARYYLDTEIARLEKKRDAK
ncbi:MAG: DUF3310 domain-containing protein [Candidatus Binataceae bacterium]